MFTIIPQNFEKKRKNLKKSKKNEKKFKNLAKTP
jgi:hypothetical protein